MRRVWIELGPCVIDRGGERFKPRIFQQGTRDRTMNPGPGSPLIRHGTGVAYYGDVEGDSNLLLG
jgi:hypothetical protein